MIKNGKGGGNTKTGLIFEGKTDLATFLNKQRGYKVVDNIVFYNEEKVARILKKHGFYEYLKEVGVDWKTIISKKLLPDDSIYVIINNTLFIIIIYTPINIKATEQSVAFIFTIYYF